MIPALRLSLIVLLPLFPKPAAASQAAPQDSTPRIAGTDLQADVAILRQAFEALHPGLYRYNSSAAIAWRFDSLSTAVSAGLTLRETYLELSRFLATIRCGHTYPNFWNQTDAVAEALYRHTGRVPFLFRWIDRRMIVTRDLSDDGDFPVGTEILTINGTPAAEILRRLITAARADGANDAKRIAYLEVIGEGRYEAFDVYFPLFFPTKAPSWTWRVREPRRQRDRSFRLAPLTPELRQSRIGQDGGQPRDSLAPAWQFRFLDAGTGYLRMKTWALYDSKWNWAGFLDSVVTSLTTSGATALIVDLRGNEGGLDAGNPILAHLTDRELALTRYERKVRYQRIPDSLRPYLDTWDRSFDDWGVAASGPDAAGFYRLTRYDDTAAGDLIQPLSPRFTGRVVALIGAANSSATFQFAQILQDAHLGTLVGQPTGGNRRGINGGAFYFLRLPHSGIEVDLPLIGTFPHDSQPDAGLVPDLPVRPNQSDIAAGIDTELEAARRLLRGSR